MAIVSFFGVGFLVRRNFRASLVRLGVIWPGWRWIAASLGVACGLVVFGLLFDQLMTRLTPEQSKSIQQVSDQLLKNVNGLPAVIALGVAAGVGEELLFRGALQPRLGNISAAFLFAALHTQYAVSLATLEILVLGLVLGLLRRRAGTTGAILAHAGYDIIVGALTLGGH
jgi:membrane protease YdiL (CAAX protease family)